MKLETITENIIRWVNTCETWNHFDAISMAIDNCLMNRKKDFGVEAVEDADHAIGSAVIARIKELGLQKNSDNPIQTDTDNAFEGNPVHGTDSINFSTFNQIPGSL